MFFSPMCVLFTRFLITKLTGYRMSFIAYKRTNTILCFHLKGPSSWTLENFNKIKVAYLHFFKIFTIFLTNSKVVQIILDYQVKLNELIFNESGAISV